MSSKNGTGGSDIKIILGANKVKTYSQISQDLVSVQSKFEKKPLKIVLGLDISKTAKRIQSDLNKALASVSLDMSRVASTQSSTTGTNKTNVGNATKVTQEAKKLSKDLSVVNLTKFESQIEKVEKELDTFGSKSAEAKKQVSALKTELGTLMGSAGTNAQSLSEDPAKFSQLQQQYNQMKILMSEVQNTKKDLAADDSFQKRIISENQALRNCITTYENFKIANSSMNNTELGGQYNKTLDTLKGMDADGGIRTQEQIEQFRLLKAQISGTVNSMKDMGIVGQSLGDKMKQQFSKLSVYFSISTVFLAAFREIKQMVSNVTELDTAMTELKKVTDETDAVYNNFLANASERAKTLGATMSDVVTATADFARLGFNISDATDLSNAAIIYKNVGDGIEDISEASQSIISTMKAFKIETADAMSIVDKFNITGNNFAISSKGIGDALQKSASSLATAGNSIDESIALITAANSVVQDPDVVGKMYAQIYSDIYVASSYIG